MAASRPRRPVAITIICVIGFLGVLIVVPILFVPQTAAIAPWYPTVLGLSAVIGLVSMIGLWRMRRWAVYLYTTITVLNQVLLLATGLWNPFALIIPGVVVAVMFAYVSRMR